MSESGKQLLVPMLVEALVIDDKVIDTAPPIREAGGHGRLLAGDGKWSPQQANYRRTLRTLGSATPKPFFGAKRKFGSETASQLVLPEDSPALPQNKDRGVYLRWMVPPGFRHGGQDLNFPPLPDHWLIVRQTRRVNHDADPTSQCWFLDGGLVVDDGDARILVEKRQNGKKERVALGLGRAVKLEDYRHEAFRDHPRTTVTATANSQTGSATFGAFAGENRNCLSWHDDLADLRQNGKLPQDLSLSYQVCGWYRDAANEPLARFKDLPADEHSFSLADRFREDLDGGSLSRTLIREFFSKGVVLPPNPKVTVLSRGRQWLITGEGLNDGFLAKKIPDGIWVQSFLPAGILTKLKLTLGATKPPEDLHQYQCVFHGQVAFINYWHGATYKGPMLGYPGAPDAHGVARRGFPPLKVGVGHSAEDALVALAARGKPHDRDQRALWKGLEAVIHRQTDRLLEGWDANAWFDSVRQNWFRPVEGGALWSIRTRERQSGSLVINHDSEKRTTPSPTSSQREALSQLNRDQVEWDGLNREHHNHQQAFYSKWRLLCRARDSQIIPLEDALEALTKPLKDLDGKRNDLKTKIDARSDSLKKSLDSSGLVLTRETAPRFWMPADPVIMVQNIGSRKKQHFDNPLPCRCLDGLVVQARVKVGEDDPQTIPRPSRNLPGLAPFLRNFPHVAAVLEGLVDEGLLVETVAAVLAKNSLPRSGTFRDAESWHRWRRRLQAGFGQGPPAEVRDQVQFFDDAQSSIPAPHLARLWGQQPWAPRFLDWEVTWRPNIDPDKVGTDLPGWEFRDGEYRSTEEPENKGYKLTGRSLMAPVDDGLVKGPLEEFRRILSAATEENAGQSDALQSEVAKVLGRHLSDCQMALSELQEGGLLGQTLSGFHQRLLGRDLSLPSISPNPEVPWNEDLESPFTDHLVLPYLQRKSEDGMPPLAPISKSKSAPFSLLRAGSLTIENMWMIDDFGQWLDVLGGSSAGRSSGMVLNPHITWPGDPLGEQISMPPRIVQPTRLHFRFAGEERQDPQNPIRGWLFFNYLDQSLGVCNGSGRLLGELAVVGRGEQRQVRWEPLGDLNHPLENPLETLVAPLRDADRLEDFLAFINYRLTHMRPSGDELGSALMGRPLAVVDAHLGLQTFGGEWTAPGDSGSSKSRLQQLRLPALLGAGSSQDGLLGFFRGKHYNSLIPAGGTQTGEGPSMRSNYLAKAEDAVVQVSTQNLEPLVLLMDPRGSAQAACGLLPAKSIRLPPGLVSEAFSEFEFSFCAGPMLISGDRLAVPTPPQEAGSWFFASGTEGDAVPVAPEIGTTARTNEPARALGGRLVFRRVQKNE